MYLHFKKCNVLPARVEESLAKQLLKYVTHFFFTTNPYVQNQDPYEQNQATTNPYVQNRDPYEQNRATTNPYVQNRDPYEQNRATTNPYGRNQAYNNKKQGYTNSNYMHDDERSY